MLLILLLFAVHAITAYHHIIDFVPNATESVSDALDRMNGWLALHSTNATYESYEIMQRPVTKLLNNGELPSVWSQVIKSSESTHILPQSSSEQGTTTIEYMEFVRLRYTSAQISRIVVSSSTSTSTTNSSHSSPTPSPKPNPSPLLTIPTNRASSCFPHSASWFWMLFLILHGAKS